MVTLQRLVGSILIASLCSGISSAREITALQDYQALFTNTKPVFIKIYADWCGACKRMSGAVSKAESNYQDQIIFAHINFDTMDSALSRELRSVRSLPTCIFIKNGKEFNKIVGSMSQDQLFKELQKLLD